MKAVIEAGKNMVDISFMPEDFSIMRIIIEGTENGRAKTCKYNLLDRFDRENQILYKARTTGYTCNAAVNLVLDGGFTKKGVNPPEFIGETEGNLACILKYLKERNINYNIESCYWSIFNLKSISPGACNLPVYFV